MGLNKEEIEKRLAEYTKYKKHLMEHKKLSEEDAEKHLKELDEEGAKKLGAEVDEHEKKLAADKKEADEKLAAEKDKEEKEKEAALSAKREKLVQLRAKRDEAEKGVRLAQSRVRLAGELANLKSAGKVTPAELKKLDVVELAGKGQEAQDAVLKSYRDRQPVVLVGVYGTTAALNAADMKKAQLSALEKETRANMRSVNKDTKLAGEQPHGIPMPQEGTHATEAPKAEQMPGHHISMGDLEIIHHAMSVGQHSEAHEHLKKLMERCKSGDPSEQGLPGAGEHMGALEESVKKMHSVIEEAEQLVSTELGVKL